MSSVPNTPAGSAPRGPTPSPLLNTPFGSQRPSSAVGRSELGSRSMRSQAQSEHDGLFEGSAGVAGSEAPEGERTIIWGTSVNVQDALRDMLAFFNEYRPAGSPVGSAPYYHACLEELHAKSVKPVFRTGKAEEEAFAQWRLQQGKRRSKSPPKTRCTCPGCERDFPA